MQGFAEVLVKRCAHIFSALQEWFAFTFSVAVFYRWLGWFLGRGRDIAMQMQGCVLQSFYQT